MTLNLTERQQLILKMALHYCRSNIDDVNDSFADFQGSLEGQIIYDNRSHPSVDLNEVDELLGELGED